MTAPGSKARRQLEAMEIGETFVLADFPGRRRESARRLIKEEFEPMGVIEALCRNRFGVITWRICGRLSKPKALDCGPLVQAFGYKPRHLAGPTYTHPSVFFSAEGARWHK